MGLSIEVWVSIACPDAEKIGMIYMVETNCALEPLLLLIVTTGM